MKIIYFISVFCFLMLTNLSAIDLNPSQEYKDSIVAQQKESQELLSSRGIKVYCQNNLLSNQEVIFLYKDYPEISTLYSTGYKYVKVSTPLLIAGIVGISAGTVLAGSGAFMLLLDPTTDAELMLATGYILVVAGNAMIPISIILKIMGGNKISGSVKKYNQSQIKSKGNTKFEYSFGIVSYGLGLQVKF